jgi:hypothetical protein
MVQIGDVLFVLLMASFRNVISAHEDDVSFKMSAQRKFFA